MSSKLEYSQVIALSPNRLQTFSATLPSPLKPVYFAFGCESLINIVNRNDFSRITIPTPDATSPVISLTFSGPNYLFCLNKKGILYAYSRSALLSAPISSYNINCTPISLVASSRYIFYISDRTLYQLSIDDFFSKQKEPKKLTDQGAEKFTELSISPCGRALTIFTIGQKSPEIWFSPFREKQHTNLPIRSNLIDFKWGLSETLICVTATDDGIVRIWEEQTDSLNMHQKSWFHFDQQILFSCFCLPIDDRHQPQRFHAAQSSNSSVFPLCKTYPFNIIVGLKNGLIYVFKESNQPQLSEITHFLLNGIDSKSENEKNKRKNRNNCVNSNCINDNSFNGDLVDDNFSDETIRYYAIADMRDDFIENQFKMLITLTLYSKKSLSFHYIEIGDSSVLTTVPYRVSFISSSIKSIETNEYNHILTQMEDNKLVNWSLVKVEPIKKSSFDFEYNITKGKVKKFFGVSVNSNVVSLTQINDSKNITLASYKLDFQPVFCKFVDQNDTVIGVVNSKDKKANILFINKDSDDDDKFIINAFPVANPPDFLINKVAFHSSDLVAVASDDEIQVFIYQDGQYNHFVSLHHENNTIIFLPKVLLAVASKRSITFFSLNSSELTKIMSIQSTHITAMSYINKSLIVSTKHVLFRLYLPKEMFPLPLSVDDDTVYTTMLSICHFSVIQDFINGKKPTLNSFLTRIETESFHFKPTKTEKETNSNSDEETKRELPYFDKFWNFLPQNWSNVDEFGMKFIFSMHLIHLHYQKLKDLFAKLTESIEKRGQIQEKSIFQITPEELKNKIDDSIQRCISFFSIWGLLSTDQSNLAKIISFKSITEICSSYLPLWMKNDIVLKKTIEKFILDNIPAPDASNYDFDAFILLCVILDKKTFAAKIAKRSHNNNKVSAFLENIENTKNEKIEKSAFAAYGQHRFSLAAMFFILRGMINQAISALGNDDKNPFLVILVARLIGYENWQSLIKKEDFYSLWWSNDESNKQKAIETISKFEFNKIRLHKYFLGNQEIVDENAEVIRQYDTIREQISLMVSAHKYEMLRRLKFHYYRRYLLDIQKIPFLIIKYVQNESPINVSINNANNETNETTENNKTITQTLFPSGEKENKKAKEKEKTKVQTKEEKKEATNDFNFSFGAGINDIDDNFDSDDFSSDETKVEEEEEEKNESKTTTTMLMKDDIDKNFKSNISDMLLTDSFESIYGEPLLLSEEYIITLLSELYNRKFSKQTIKFLLSVAQDLLSLPQSLHIISMIMFSITFSLSDFTWMAPIIQFNFDPLYIITVLDHYTELLNSKNDDENSPINKLFNKEKNHVEKGFLPAKKVKKNSNPNLNSPRHIVKSNSMTSFNQLPRIPASTSFSKVKRNIYNNVKLRSNALNADRSDELISIVDTDNDSSSTEEEDRDNGLYSVSINNNEVDDDLPNFFAIICPNIIPTRGDKELACFVAFDRMLTVLNELLTNSNPTIFTSFLHHRHRLMYRKIRSFRFSQSDFMKDLDAAGLKCQIVERMRHTRENRTWMISLADNFTSPFFTPSRSSFQISNSNSNSNSSSFMNNYNFQYTASYNIKTASNRVYDVCIDPCNNQSIAIVSKQVALLNATSPAILRDMSYSLAEHELKNNEIDGLNFTSPTKDKSLNVRQNEEEFKSPLLSFLTQQKIAKWEKVTREVLLTRSFDVKWPKSTNQTAKTVKARCVASHPSKGSFVSGDSSGHLHYWKFVDGPSSPSFLQPSNVAKFFHGDYKIRSVLFNKAGDRVCSLDSNGRVAVSDFIGFTTFNVESQYSSISWLNNDNQFVVVSNTNIDLNDDRLSKNDDRLNSPLPPLPTPPVVKNIRQSLIPKTSPSVDNLTSLSQLRELRSPYQNRSIAQSTTFTSEKKVASILIYDVLAGEKPVASYDIGKPLPKPKAKIPLDVFGPFVFTGHNDGSAVIFDVRCGMRLAHLPLHSQPVTAVKFDLSGTFFVTGGMDNNVVVGEALSFAEFNHLDDVLPNYDPKSKKRGIFNVAVSKQTIAACGYSSHIHVWTKMGPNPM